MQIQNILKVSRPRFWLYAGGTYAVGIIAGASVWSDLYHWNYVIYLMYFMVPANMFIYGINDLYDDDTDAHNAKKDDREHRLMDSERRMTMILVSISAFLGVLVAVLAPNWKSSLLILIFLFLAWAYSSKPFRFKSKPFIDAISNVHYALIGFAGYAMVTGNFPPVWAVVAAWAWTASMHIFSAVPDIEADAKAGLNTTAIFLGKCRALLICSGLWVITAIALYVGDFYRSFAPAAIFLYVIVPLLLLNKNQAVITKVYWYFPIVNAVYGFTLFWLLALSKW